MARLARKNQKIFALSATNNGQFGAAQANTFVLSQDLDTLQALAAWANGWDDATISGQRLPTLEEFQTLNYVGTYQLAYIFQEGIPEWNTSTNYFTNSVVKKAGTYQLYGSLTDNNQGNALTDGTKWVLLLDLSATGGISYGTTTNSGNTYTVTLSPAITSLSQAQIYLVKYNAANTGAVTLNPNGIGATGVKDFQGNALAGTEIIANSYYFHIFDGTNLRIMTGIPMATTALAGIVMLAAGSDVKTGTSNTLVPPVSALVQHQGIAKAWVKFNGNGTPAVTNGYNVSSITDNGTGDYTVNFTTAFANANYVPMGIAGWSGGPNPLLSQRQATAPTTSACRFLTTESSSAVAIDPERVFISFVGEQ